MSHTATEVEKTRFIHRLTNRHGTAMQYDARLGALITWDGDKSPVWVTPEAFRPEHETLDGMLHRYRGDHPGDADFAEGASDA